MLAAAPVVRTIEDGNVCASIAPALPKVKGTCAGEADATWGLRPAVEGKSNDEPGNIVEERRWSSRDAVA